MWPGVACKQATGRQGTGREALGARSFFVKGFRVPRLIIPSHRQIRYVLGPPPCGILGLKTMVVGLKNQGFLWEFTRISVGIHKGFVGIHKGFCGNSHGFLWDSQNHS